MTAVETIGQAHDADWSASARCAYGRREGLKSIRECRERLDIDLPTLIWTRGRDMPLAMLSERMRCPRCGSRRVRLIFVPPDGRSVVAA